MKKRTLCVIAMVVLGLFTVSWALYGVMWAHWIYPKDYEYSLILADDASLPDVKSKYLTDYISKVKTITGTPRYIFMKPDLELKTQIQILEGLVQRFNDIAKIQPSEMAYQQGMQQLTGQEMENQLNRISSIFMSAKLRENLIRYMFIVWSWILWIGGLIYLSIIYDNLPHN